ncbi:MAG: penicillin-binding protein activator LpoB [Candidatus Cloacimonetes bacterium]|nr:penicillin-binding protein activator LpoB [Candidatus Cloacimonadota bacterium]
MKKLQILGIVFLLLLMLGCASQTRTITRTSSQEVTDYSGNWNDTDARLVAEQMIKDMISRSWITDYILENDHKPVVIVGNVRNKSSEHIDSEIFVKDIERELINSGKVKFVATSNERKEILAERYHQQSYASEETAKSIAQETGADFVLIGSIKSTMDAISGKAAKFYQIDMELINIESNEKVWIGQKEIKKLISQSKTKW